MIKKIIFLILLVLSFGANIVYADTYICSDITTGTPSASQTQTCNTGTLRNGAAGELCPYSQTPCTQQTSTPQCPQGYTWNGSTCTETNTAQVTLSASGQITSYNGFASTITAQTTVTADVLSPETVCTGYSWYGNYCVSYTTEYVVTSYACPSGWTYNSGNETCSAPSGDIGLVSTGTSETCFSSDNYNPQVITYNPSTNSFSGQWNTSGSTNSGWWWSAVVSGAGNGISASISQNLNAGCSLAIGDGGISYNQSGNAFSGSIGFGGNATWSYISGSGNCIVGDGGAFGTSGQICFTDTCPSGYTLSNGTCVSTNTASPTCPSGTTLINNECVSPWTCPVSGNGGDSATCIEPSGSSAYYCSPYSCYTDASGTSVSTTPTSANLPPPQTNNGTVTSGGCEGSVYLFPGTSMQCRSGGEQTAWQDCCNASSYLFGQIKCTTQEQSVAKDLQYDTQYGANGYSNPNGYGGSGNAQYVGSYCSDNFLGLCLEHMKVYCVFHSLLGLIIQEQGRAQLGIGFGSPQNPNCSGLTPTQFQELNFSNFDFTEYVTVLENKIKAGVINTNTLNQMQNYTNTITNQISNYENELSGVNP